MGDVRITSQPQPKIETAETSENNSSETPQVSTQPQVSTAKDAEFDANTKEAMNRAGTEKRGILDTGGEYLRKILGEQFLSPSMNDLDPQSELQRMLQDVDPNQTEPKAPGQATQQVFERGMVLAQFAAPIALPNAAKGLVDVKLNQEQQEAKADFEKSPAWKTLTDAEKNQITKDLSRASGKNLQPQIDKTKSRLEAIETVSKRSAWKELSPPQQQKITGEILKLSGDQLKNDLTKIGGKFDSIEKIAQSPGWSLLNADQKAKLTDPMLTLSGDKLKTHLTQTQEKLDSLTSFTKQPSWKQLQTADQQKVVDHILKTPQDKLKLTTENVQATADFVGNLRSNNVDPGKTMDKLLNLESQKSQYVPNPQKSFEKIKTALAEAGTQINAAKDKKIAATDVKDMLDFSIDRGTKVSLSKLDPAETRGEIAQRFLKQYKGDPDDFHKTRDLLKNMSDAHLTVHLLNSNQIGVDIPGNANKIDLKNVKNVPAGEETKYKHAIGNMFQREGNFDTINFWDNQMISLGARQWSTYGGDLNPLLQEFQKSNPDKFKELLPGITLEKGGVFYNGKALTPEKGKSGQDMTSLLGNLKQSEIVGLSNMFNKLGKDADFQKIQLQDMTTRMNKTMDASVGSHKIGDYVKGERGFGQIVSYEAYGPAWISETFGKSVKGFAGELGLKSDAPSRQELMDTLRLKLQGKQDPKNPKNNIEPDKAFIEQFEKRYGKDSAAKLKTDASLAEFVEKRLIQGFKENFLDKVGASNRDRFSKRFDSTDKYYDKL
jgi:hypothetical protein